MKNDKPKKLVLNNDISTIVFDQIENMEKNGYIKELREIVDIFGFDTVRISKKETKKLVKEDINFIFYCLYKENAEEDNTNENGNESDNDNDNGNSIMQSDISELIELSERKFSNIIIKEVKHDNNNKSKKS
jgi:hypothetical protein